MVKNSAFVFIKPHANTVEARKVVKETLESKGIEVTKEGLITGKEIDEKQLIDNHYYAIASKATILKPNQLNVPEKMFAEKFGSAIEGCDTWQNALSANKVFNAKDACVYFGMNSEELNTEWAKAKKGGKLVKFGGGFYCGLIDTVEGKEPVFVMNGFFMSMRSNFVAESASIYYFVVEWEEKSLAWDRFRGDLLGPTDPKEAPEDSLRGMFFKDWEKYGLGYEPNVGDNAVHASASPFEALSEKMNWVGVDAKKDEFGQAVLRVLDENTLTKWSRDPQIRYGVAGTKLTKSCFDLLEDTDASYCLALLGMLYAQSDDEAFEKLTRELRTKNEAEAMGA